MASLTPIAYLLCVSISHVQFVKIALSSNWQTVGSLMA